MYKLLSAIIVFWSVIGLVSCSPSASSQKDVMIIPQPKEITYSNGKFLLKEGMVIGVANEQLLPAAEYLSTMLSKATGFTLQTAVGDGSIQLSLCEGEGPEGAYQLHVSSNKLEIKGQSYGAVISGIETLRQLLPAEIEASTVMSGVEWSVPALQINDAPRLAWRGLMLDVSRHFYTKEEVKELLDMMALYKLNKFHWHLTDDQGWRIEIKKYPLLTERGAWRSFNNQDRQCMDLAVKGDNPDFNIPEDKLQIVQGDTLYGGFYTQEDVKEIVAYAAVRGIDVIPEVDMPGHMLAAISNYKGISCFDKVGWGDVFSSPVCPGKESALEFCKNVYSEIFPLFPYKYVHLGADEVEKINWKKCPDCQKRMRDNGLKTEEELQAWFVHTMEKFFNENGKEMIGWDEILEGGLSETATIMWWRTWNPEAVPMATAQGNHAILSPNANYYLDYQQDKNSIKNMYNFEPVIDILNADQKKLILGLQANVWCETIPSRERMQYMVMPRMLALAEVAWVEPEAKDWNRFVNHMVAQFPRLDVMNVNYRIPDLEGFYETNAFVGEGLLDIKCLAPDVEIHYTTDGTIPTVESALYEGAMKVTETTDFTFCTFRANGKKGDIVKTRFISDELAKGVDAQPAQPGLQAVWHEYGGDECAGIETAPVRGTYQISQIEIPTEVKGKIGLVITGYFNAPVDGVYTFMLLSDDGSILKIGDNVVVDNDGAHAPRERIGQKALAKGLHPIEVKYFDHNGGVLNLKIIDPNGKELPADASLFLHD